MKLHMVRFLAICAVLSMACNFGTRTNGAVQPGATETVEIAEAAPSGAAHLDIRMGGGTLNLSGGSTSLVSGTISYNVSQWKPTVNRSGDTVTIEQEIKGIPIPRGDNKMVNDWKLQLGDAPMALSIEAGAFKGDLDLTGVPLTQLDVADGASEVNVKFDEPNPQDMSELNYKTGASSVTLSGLGNANFAKMTFSGGAGKYVLDFSGQPAQQGTVNINAAAGDLTIIVPSGVTASVQLNGALHNVDTEGTWTVSNNTYSLSGSTPGLDITVDMSLGNLKLQTQ